MGEQDLKDITSAVVKELTPFIKLGKMLRWFAVTTISLMLGIGSIAVWVHNVTAATIKTHEEVVALQQWKTEKDAIDVRLLTLDEQIQKILDRQQDFIDRHGPPSEKNPH